MARTATATAPMSPAATLPAPEVVVLVEVAAEPVEVPVAEPVEDASVEDASVAEAVDEPVLVLLALIVAALASLPVPVELLVADAEARVELLVAVPVDVAVAEPEEELDDEVEPSVMLNWFYVCGTPCQ